MIGNLFKSTTIPVVEQVVAFTQARHGVLAGNVANMDTPGYRTRDLSTDLFESKLKEAVDARYQPPVSNPGSEHPWPLAPSTTGSQPDALDSFREVKDSIKSILYHDESDVAIEKQITELAKNQAKHNLALTIMISQFQLLEAAISERA